MGSLNVMLILGSVRNGRMVERVSNLVQNSIKSNTSLAVSIMDPLASDLNSDMNRQPMHWMGNTEKVPGWMKSANEKIIQANGLMLLCSEYNGMMPPALTNLMNTFPPSSFRHRPCGIVTYSMGTTGAMRALNNARPYASELGLLVVPGYVPIPIVHECVNERGVCSNKLVNENLARLVKNLEWYVKAISEHRRKENAFPD